MYKEKNKINFFIDIHLQIVLLHILYAVNLILCTGRRRRMHTHTYMCVEMSMEDKRGQITMDSENKTPVLARTVSTESLLQPLLCTVKKIASLLGPLFP